MISPRRIIAAGALLPSIPAVGFPQTAKVDPKLSFLIRQGADLTTAKKEEVLKSAPQQAAPSPTFSIYLAPPIRL